MTTGGANSLGRVAWSGSAGAMQTSGNVGAVNFAPTYAGSSVWFAAADGNVTRVDAGTGRVEWRVNVGKPLIAGVGSDGDTVIVAARDGTLIAMDSAGKTKWTSKSESEIVTVPAVGSGIAVVRYSDNRLYGFDAETGKRRWQVQRQSPALVLRQTNSSAIDANNVYAGLPGGRLIAIAHKTGAVRWEVAVSQPKGANEIERIADVVGTPLISGRDICAATYQGRLTCFQVSNGQPLWSKEVSATAGIEIDPRAVVAVDVNGAIFAYSRSGTSIWQQTKLLKRASTAPIALDGHILIGDVEGFVYVLSKDSGEILGRVATDSSPLLAAPCIAAKTAVFQTSRGGVYAISV